MATSVSKSRAWDDQNLHGGAFCSFERIEVRDMRRLNLLVGDSGSGKTALLEAIYLAMGVSPELALRIRAWRNQEPFQLTKAALTTRQP